MRCNRPTNPFIESLTTAASSAWRRRFKYKKFEIYHSRHKQQVWLIEINVENSTDESGLKDLKEFLKVMNDNENA